MIKEPYFSIVTPTLNSEKTIETTIRSVISQPNVFVEYLIVDGVSTDQTISRIHEVDETIEIFQELDSGIFDAMNKGVAKASGKIVGIINSDDWYLPGTLEIVREVFESTGADVVFGGVEVFSQGVLIGMRAHSCYEINSNMISHPAIFVRRAVYQEIGAFNLDYKVAADYDFLLRAHKSGLKFSKIDRNLAAYTLDGYSDSARNRIISILETESIRFKNGVVSRNRAIAQFVEYSTKTIIKRSNRLVMMHEFISSVMKLGRYFNEGARYERK